MSDTRYIIEYLPGCKGDMLTRLLNSEQPLINDDGRTLGNTSLLKDFSNLELIGKKKPCIEEFEKTISRIEGKFTNAHTLFFLNDRRYKEILDSRGFSIKKIIFDKKYYRTVYVEHIFKNAKGPRSSVIEEILNFKPKEDFYNIDYFLHEQNIPINDENRSEYFHDSLLKSRNIILELFNTSKHKNRDLWSYQDLYIDLNLTDPLFQHVDLKDYKEAVEKSWLPDEIFLFGESWKPRDYGYRSF